MSRIVVCFSGRAQGNCERLGNVARQSLQRLHPAEEVEQFCFSQADARCCGQCNYECLKPGMRCPKAGDAIWELYERMAAAQECVFVLPNYADYPCANFFLFAERGTGWFDGSEERLARYMRVPKKAIVVSGSEQENFRRVLQYQAEEMQILFLSAREYGQSSLEGRLDENERACRVVRAGMGE